jgi:5-methylthioadenosine/S-adenosylhomocysteine deaminase
MSILVKNATIITQDSSRTILRGDLLLEGDSIAAVGGKIKEKADETIDASGMIAMPGLVNAHTHVGMTLLRGYCDDLPLEQWLRDRIWPLEARQTPEDAGIAARLAFCEMIRSGTTSFADMCIHDPEHVFRAAKEAGMRGIIARGLMDFRTKDFTLRVLKEVEKSLGYGSVIVRPSLSAHAPYTCSEELMVKTKELARRKKLRYQIHVSETRKEIFDVLGWTGKYPYEYLDSIGLMDSGSIFAHGGWLTKREINLAGKRKLNVASCPVSSLKLATGGITQLAELDAAGANVCLGTDGAASNNCLDMFQTLKMAALLQKHHYWKADILPTQKFLDFATRNGAKALGLNCGSIEKGKLADIILLERGPNLRPGHDIIADIVYSAGPQNVSDVIINGKIVMRKREIKTLNEKKIMEDAETAASNLFSG